MNISAVEGKKSFNENILAHILITIFYKKNKKFSCSPKSFKLCQKLGYSECNFGLGSVSREDILKHFTEAHKTADLKPTPFFKCLKKFIFLAKCGREAITTCLIVGKTTADEDTSPLFLVSGKTMKNSELIWWQIYQFWRPQEEADDDEFEDYEGEQQADEYIMDILFMLQPKVKSRTSIFSSSQLNWRLSDCQTITKNPNEVSICVIDCSYGFT